MSKIKCSVLECQYNRDVMCDAPMIQVNHSGTRHSKESEEHSVIPLNEEALNWSLYFFD
jgi:hypothetical protein